MPTEPRNIGDEWKPGTVMRTTCPWPYCHGLVNVLRHAPSSDRLDLQVDTVEQHAIIGPNSWYQVLCPGSHLLIPLSDKGREVLTDHNERFREAAAARLNREHPEAASDLAEQNAKIEARKRAGTLGHLDGPGETYFPPRPSDVEEAEQQTGGVVPAGVKGIKITGRGGSVTSAHEGTINLLNLTKQTIGNGQEDSSSASHIVELVDAKLKSVTEHYEAAAALLASAAMGSASSPHLIDEAATMISAAQIHLDEASARLAGTMTKVHDGYQAALHAIEKIEEFIAQISA